MSKGDVRIEVRAFMNETEKAICVLIKNGGERWVPISVCNKIVRKPMPEPKMGTGKSGWIEVEGWWARKEGLAEE